MKRGREESRLFVVYRRSFERRKRFSPFALSFPLSFDTNIGFQMWKSQKATYCKRCFDQEFAVHSWWHLLVSCSGAQPFRKYRQRLNADEANCVPCHLSDHKKCVHQLLVIARNIRTFCAYLRSKWALEVTVFEGRKLRLELSNYLKRKFRWEIYAFNISWPH